MSDVGDHVLRVCGHRSRGSQGGKAKGGGGDDVAHVVLFAVKVNLETVFHRGTLGGADATHLDLHQTYSFNGI